MNIKDTLLGKIENAKALDFGDIFSKSIELFKKVWLQGLVTLLLTFAMMIPFYIIMYVPLIAMGVLDPEALQEGGELNMAILIPFYLCMLVFMFFAMIVGFGLKSAFYRICKAKDLNEISSDDYFYFFKKPYLRKTIKLAAMTFGISLVAVLLCVIPIIYVMVPIALIRTMESLILRVPLGSKNHRRLGPFRVFKAFGFPDVSIFLFQFIQRARIQGPHRTGFHAVRHLVCLPAIDTKITFSHSGPFFGTELGSIVRAGFQAFGITFLIADAGLAVHQNNAVPLSFANGSLRTCRNTDRVDAMPACGNGVADKHLRAGSFFRIMDVHPVLGPGRNIVPVFAGHPACAATGAAGLIEIKSYLHDSFPIHKPAKTN